MRRKNNYVMSKLHTPKRVTLPNRRTFLARYKRVPRSKLSANVTLTRRYRGGVVAGRRRKASRKDQRGSGFFDTLEKIAKIH